MHGKGLKTLIEGLGKLKVFPLMGLKRINKKEALQFVLKSFKIGIEGFEINEKI